MATPAGLSGCSFADARVFGAGSHRRRLSADDPEEGKQSDDADSNCQEVDVFPIHKTGRMLHRGELIAESSKQIMGCQER